MRHFDIAQSYSLHENTTFSFAGFVYRNSKSSLSGEGGGGRITTDYVNIKNVVNMVIVCI